MYLQLMRFLRFLVELVKEAWERSASTADKPTIRERLAERRNASERRSKRERSQQRKRDLDKSFGRATGGSAVSRDRSQAPRTDSPRAARIESGREPSQTTQTQTLERHSAPSADRSTRADLGPAVTKTNTVVVEKPATVTVVKPVPAEVPVLRESSANARLITTDMGRLAHESDKSNKARVAHTMATEAQSSRRIESPRDKAIIAFLEEKLGKATAKSDQRISNLESKISQKSAKLDTTDQNTVGNFVKAQNDFRRSQLEHTKAELDRTRALLTATEQKRLAASVKAMQRDIEVKLRIAAEERERAYAMNPLVRTIVETVILGSVAIPALDVALTVDRWLHKR